MSNARRVYIQAAAAIGPTGSDAPAALAGDPPPYDLRALSRQVLGQVLRQASNFITLATVGAALCVQRAGTVAPGTTIYLATGLGDVRSTEAVIQQVAAPGAAVMPFDFINANNNMSGFYVARMAGVRSRNLTVTADDGSFETALMLARSEITQGIGATALVGGVDEDSHPRERHLRRLPLRADQILGAGSAWLYMSSEPRGALAELTAVEMVRTDRWMRAAERLLGSRTVAGASLLPGYRLADADVSALAGRVPEMEVIPYVRYCGCYPTAAAFGVASALTKSRDTGRMYLHANHVGLDRTALVALNAFAVNPPPAAR